MTITLEQLQQQLLSLQEKMTEVEEQNTTLKTSLDEKETKIKDLETINQKLFIRATTTISQPESEEKEEIPSFIDEETVKLLDKRDIELMKEIAKGEDY